MVARPLQKPYDFLVSFVLSVKDYVIAVSFHSDIFAPQYQQYGTSVFFA